MTTRAGLRTRTRVAATAAIAVALLAGLTAPARGATPHAGTPSLTSLSITVVNQTEVTYLVVNGRGFEAGAAVSLGGGVRCQVQSVTATKVAVRLEVDPYANAGLRTVSVTNPDGRIGRLRGALRVEYAPELRRWAVGEGASGWTTVLARPYFASPPTIKFSGTGVTLKSEAVGSDGLLHVSFDVSRYAPATWRSMTISAGLADWSVLHGLKVRLAPTVSSVTPLGRGATAQGVRVEGANFEVCATKEPALAISGTGVSVDAVSAARGGLLYAALTVSATAPLGARAVTVVNCDSGGSSTSAGTFTVLGAPVVTSVSPIALGVERTETFGGANLTPDTTLAASGTGITIDHVQYVSPSKLRARITVAQTAGLGHHDVTATDSGPGGESTLTAGLLVVDGDPTATSLGAVGIGANTSVPLTVRGSGFEKGAVVVADDTSPQGPYLAFGRVTLASSSELEVTATALDDTPLGTVQVTVLNKDGGTTAPIALATNPGPRLRVEPSARHPDALTVAMTPAVGAPAGISYAVRLCLNRSLTQRCSVRGIAPGVMTVGGLIPGGRYFAQAVAPAMASFATAASALVGPRPATVQLGRPTITRALLAHDALSVTFRPSTHAASGQRYTLRICANAAMTVRCLVRPAYRSGIAIGLLRPVAFVWVLAVGAKGYLAAASPIVRAR